MQYRVPRNSFTCLNFTNSLHLFRRFKTNTQRTRTRTHTPAPTPTPPRKHTHSLHNSCLWRTGRRLATTGGVGSNLVARCEHRSRSRRLGGRNGRGAWPGSVGNVLRFRRALPVGGGGAQPLRRKAGGSRAGVRYRKRCAFRGGLVRCFGGVLGDFLGQSQYASPGGGAVRLPADRGGGVRGVPPCSPGLPGTDTGRQKRAAALRGGTVVEGVGLDWNVIVCLREREREREKREYAA